jgi:hypothetical protein
VDEHLDLDHLNLYFKENKYVPFFLEAEWKGIQESIQSDWAYGNRAFLKEMSSMTGSIFEFQKTGRNPKQVNDILTEK